MVLPGIAAVGVGVDAAIGVGVLLLSGVAPLEPLFLDEEALGTRECRVVVAFL